MKRVLILIGLTFVNPVLAKPLRQFGVIGRPNPSPVPSPAPVIEKSKKLPNKISDSDRYELMLIEAMKQDAIVKKQLLQTQAELLQCQSTRSSATLEERKKKLLDLYKLSDGDTLKDDGTIVRKK